MQPAVYPQGPPFQPPPPPQRTGMPWWGWLLIVLLGGPCVFGVIAAISIPAFVRYIRRAKQAEARTYLAQLCSATTRYAGEHNELPPSASMTPSSVPRGLRVVDAADTWNQPGWQALGFSVADPHYYSYELVRSGNTFVVRAYGDLDGNGVLSTFERQGTFAPGRGATCGPVQSNQESE